MAIHRQDYDWAKRLKRACEAGQKFIIPHFNVDDEVADGKDITSVKDVFISGMDSEGFVVYTMAGFEFDSWESEVLFREIVGEWVPPKHPGEPPVYDENDPLANEKQKAYSDALNGWNMWNKAVEEAKEKKIEVSQVVPKIPALPSVAYDYLNTFIHTPTYKMEFEGEEKEYDISKYAVVFDYAHTIAPAADNVSKGDSQRLLEIFLSKWSEQKDGPTIVLFARNLTDVDSNLYGRGSNGTTIKVGYPTVEEREAYMKLLQKELGFKLNGSPLNEVARLSSGLTNKHIRSLATECVAEDKAITKNDVLDYKQAVIADELAGMVEFVVPMHGFEAIGGLDHVKSELAEVREAMLAGQDWRVPMGILLVGPPGTGKTVIAEAFAKSMGFSFIRMGNIKSKWVGESERNITKVFDQAKELAPVVIFVDEIDQEGSRGYEGDGGVSNHMFAAILRTMSDTDLRGRVMWIAATNRPDLMDAAMKRPGRFDIRIPLLYPTAQEREAIFQAMFTKYDLVAGRGIDWTTLAQLTDDHSGADIEVITLSAARFAFREDGSKIVKMENLIEAIDDYIPHHDREEIGKQTKMALNEASSIRLLPERYREGARAEKRKGRETLGLKEAK